MCFCAIAWVSNRSITITQYRCKTSMSSREGGLTFLLSFLDLYSGFNSAMCHHEPDRRDTWLTLMIIVGTQNIGNTRETARNCAEKGRHIVGEIVIMLRYFKSFLFQCSKDSRGVLHLDTWCGSSFVSGGPNTPTPQESSFTQP